MPRRRERVSRTLSEYRGSRLARLMPVHPRSGGNHPTTTRSVEARSGRDGAAVASLRRARGRAQGLSASLRRPRTKTSCDLLGSPPRSPIGSGGMEPASRRGRQAWRCDSPRSSKSDARRRDRVDTAASPKGCRDSARRYSVRGQVNAASSGGGPGGSPPCAEMTATRSPSSLARTLVA